MDEIDPVPCPLANAGPKELLGIDPLGQVVVAVAPGHKGLIADDPCSAWIVVKENSSSCLGYYKG